MIDNALPTLHPVPRVRLTDGDLQPLIERLIRADSAHRSAFPGDSGERQPVHVVYGGAHLFKAGTAARLGAIALEALRSYAVDAADFAECLGIAPALADAVYSRVLRKLQREPIEDYRLDFEDGYGYRPDREEDAHAIASARELAAGCGQPLFPPYTGFRIKPLTEALRARSIRTFQLFMDALLEAGHGRLPGGFVVALPKVTSREQVAVLAELLDLYESRAGLAAGSIRLELMIETVQAIVAADGRVALPGLMEAARGRCRGVHFGAYDYSADCNITAMYQSMSHPACDFARNVMQVSLTGRGVMLSDSLTAVMPVAIHKGSELTAQEVAENRQSIRRAWRLHFEDTRRSLANGFYQGWDLHPAQFPTRYAAVYSFFLEGLETASRRLRNFMEKAAQATTAGSAFDDAATAQGLLNFFLRGLNCGAITEEEALATGLTMEELQSKSFATIMRSR
jgi:citrate lyase beta subunit